MRLLLDTHVVLWWLAAGPELSNELKVLINEEPEVYLSPVAVWEVALKQSSGKLKGPTYLPERMRDRQLRHLPVTIEHGIAAGRLPMIHRDPFDRMLVAQARCEGLTLVTRDAEIQRYDVEVLSA